MEKLLNKEILKLVENKINEKASDEASIYEYDLKPAAVQGLVYRYDISVDMTIGVTFIGETTDNYKSYSDGESWDDVQTEHDLGVTVSTLNSEAACFYVDIKTGEIHIPKIESAKPMEVFDIEKIDSFDDTIYNNDYKDPDNWDDGYLDDLKIEEISFSVEPNTLFTED